MASADAAGDGTRRYRCYKCDSEFRSAAVGTRIFAPCGHQVTAWRARVAFFGENEMIAALAAGPKRSGELHSLGGVARELTHWLKVPTRAGDGGNGKSRPGRATATPIAYLPGDERAAIRLFIEENRAFVESCLADGSNPIVQNWPDDLYQMLVEQYEWQDSGPADADGPGGGADE